MSTKKKATSSAVHSSEKADADRPYVLHPDNDDRFVQTGQQVIRACELGISVKVWLEEFHSLIEAVTKWAQREDVKACYVAPRGASIGLYFVPMSDSFDFDLADKLAPMNREWLMQYNVGMIEVHQIPENQVGRFIPPNTGRVLWPQGQSPHNAVEA